jgi:hypothetical protein
VRIRGKKQRRKKKRRKVQKICSLARKACVRAKEVMASGEISAIKKSRILHLAWEQEKRCFKGIGQT